MATSSGEPIDDQLIARYLVGGLSAEEAERLDERSVADEEFAWRIRAVENDLVDAYARGELSGELLERFRTSYLTSPLRRRKAEFAEALAAYDDRAAETVSGGPARSGAYPMDDRTSAVAGVHGASRLVPAWALAAAAVLALAAAAYLYAENQRLREQVSRTLAARADLERTTQGLQTELEQERSIGAAIRDELDRLRGSLPTVRAPSLRPFTLVPLRRGADRIAAISLPEGTARVSFRLRLESDDYPNYEAALRNPATGQIIWRSGRLATRSDGSVVYVELRVPSSLLKGQNYTLDLAGLPVGGPAESVSSYAFRVVRE